MRRADQVAEPSDKPVAEAILAGQVNPANAVTEAIVAAICEVKFGEVNIIIQDSKVIQINKTEKMRLDK